MPELPVPQPNKSQPEREHTDESLRTERAKTDLAIGATSPSEQEAAADEVLEHARDRADAVLETARAAADHQLSEQRPAGGKASVTQQRAVADEILETERAAADERLRLERELEVERLQTLLPLEREKTDRYLLTERIRSDVALANRDDFLGMVTHDLRNLLSGILLNTEALADKASESEEGQRTVIGMQRIQRYVARASRLIGDLVDVVSIDAGKLTVNIVRGDGARLVAEALEAFAQGALEKGVKLEATIVEPALPADFDHDRMLQVLANLIANALKFSRSGGSIVVRAAAHGGGLRMSVTDNGAGIPGNMLELIFERFWQVGKADRRGLGLGLYISKCIVDAHGGKIWAESQLGDGSTFHVTLPPPKIAVVKR